MVYSEVVVVLDQDVLCWLVLELELGLVQAVGLSGLDRVRVNKLHSGRVVVVVAARVEIGATVGVESLLHLLHQLLLATEHLHGCLDQTAAGLETLS